MIRLNMKFITSSPNVSLGFLTRGTILVLVFWLSIYLSVNYLLFETSEGSSSPVFLFSGLMLSTLLYFGLRYSIFVFLGFLTYSMSESNEVTIALLISLAVISSIYIFESYLLTEKFGIDFNFAKSRDIVILLIIATILPFTVLIGAYPIFFLLDNNQFGEFLIAIIHFWLSDVTGIITLTPILLITFSKFGEYRQQSILKFKVDKMKKMNLSNIIRNHFELILTYLSLIMVQFTLALINRSTGVYLYYLSFFPLLWLAVRFGISETSSGVLLSLLISLFIFQNFNVTLDFLEFQILFIVFSSLSLILSIINDDRNKINEYNSLLKDTIRITNNLELYEERLSLLIKTLPNIILITNSKGTIEYLNKSFAGIEAGKIIGKSITTLFDGGYARQLNEFLANFETAKLTDEISISYNGKSSWYKIDYGFNKSNQKVELIFSLSDITEIKELEMTLMKNEKELVVINKELEHFANIASHDLQEPLRMVTSYLNLLEKKYKGNLDETGLKYIRYAVDGSKRMKVLINDLLVYSKVGSREKEPQVVDLQNLLTEVRNDLQVMIAETQATLTIDKLPLVMGDEIQLKQLFQNLLVNSMKFHRDGIPPEVQIQTRNIEGGTVIAIQDNGIGIDSKYHEKIFVIYQRLHRREEFSGTGLGLAISKKVVDSHHGKIWLESEVNKGTTFFIQLKFLT